MVTNPQFSLFGNHRIYTGARVLTQIADLYFVMANQRAKNIDVIG